MTQNNSYKLAERGAAFVLETGKALLIYKRDSRNDINVGIVNAHIQAKYCSHLQSSVFIEYVREAEFDGNKTDRYIYLEGVHTISKALRTPKFFARLKSIFIADNATFNHDHNYLKVIKHLTDFLLDNNQSVLL